MEQLTHILRQSLENNPLLSFLIVFLAGIMVSFAPCVYPLMPATFGYIGARAKGSKIKGFFLSLLYVFGIAIVYALLGVFASLSGKIFGQFTSNFFTYFIAGNIFIFLGLSLLDVFSLPSILLPFRIKPSNKDIIGVFLVGLVSGFVVGPCTAPILGALLVYVAARESILYGALLLFTFAYGMGFLLILIGTFSGLINNLPKSGEWLIRIKKINGFILIFLGEYFLITAGGFW